jgi:ribonuclease HI
MSKASPTTLPTPATGIELLLARFGVRDWDIVLVGDGSGSTWERAMGWGTVSVERSSGTVRRWCGMASHGTNNVAEILAYVHPLLHFAEVPDRPRLLRVHIVTDSQYVRDAGRRRGAGVKRNLALWAAVQAVERQGLVLFWHWLERDSHPANVHADALSRFCRKLLEAYNPLEAIDSSPGI